LRRLASTLPVSALVLETDAPDIPPWWLYRTAAERAAGVPQGRNEPAQLPRIAQTLAALRAMDVPELARQLRDNAQQALPRLSPLLAPFAGPLAGPFAGDLTPAQSEPPPT
jgi:TatD DNase family protein